MIRKNDVPFLAKLRILQGAVVLGGNLLPSLLKYAAYSMPSNETLVFEIRNAWDSYWKEVLLYAFVYT